MNTALSHSCLWVWAGQRAGDAISISQVLPLRMVLCCDDAPEGFFDSQVEVFSFEEETGRRVDLSNRLLNAALQGDLGERFERRLAEHTGPIGIVAYRSTDGLERLAARRQDIHILAKCGS